MCRWSISLFLAVMLLVYISAASAGSVSPNSWRPYVNDRVLVTLGMTKGEVYWALGKIHIELGQGPKAKSMFQRGLEIEPGNQKLREALSSLQ